MIESEEYEEGGTHLRGHMPENHSGPFYAFQRTPEAPEVQELVKTDIHVISEHSA